MSVPGDGSRGVRRACEDQAVSTPTPRPSAASGTGDHGESVPAPERAEAAAPPPTAAHGPADRARPHDPAEPPFAPGGADPALALDGGHPARPTLRRRLLVALAVAVVIAALGVPLGLLWSTVAPHLPVRMSADGPTLISPEPEQFIADEGWYVILGAAYGMLAAALAWALLRRYRGPVALVALVVGTTAAGIVAWKVGSGLGHAHYEYLKAHAPVGSVFGKPVALRVGTVPLLGIGPGVPGDTLVAALVAAATYLLFTGFSVDPHLRPYREVSGGEGPGRAAERSWSAPAAPYPAETDPYPAEPAPGPTGPALEEPAAAPEPADGRDERPRREGPDAP